MLQDQPPFDLSFVDQLLSSPGELTTKATEGLAAERCGRNEVWRIDVQSGETFFLKRCADHADYDRQRFGLQLGMKMAIADNRFFAASLVHEDSERGILITTEIGGSRVDELLKRAYRIDKNPWRRRERREIARRAVQALVDWLKQLHRWELTEGLPLHDHRPDEVARRINEKLETTCEGTTFASRLGLSQLRTVQQFDEPTCVVFGDVSLSNFFFDGSKVGAVDFEDIGQGPQSRDLVALRRRLEEAFRHLYYYPDSALVAVIPKGRKPVANLFELEDRVLRYESLSTSGGIVDRLLASSERREIRKLWARLT